MNLGPAEILVILVVALIVFGPKRLPEVARQVGTAMRQLRKMQDNVRAELTRRVAPRPESRRRRTDGATATDVDHAALPAPPTDESPADTQTTDDGFVGPAGSFS